MRGRRPRCAAALDGLAVAVLLLAPTAACANQPVPQPQNTPGRASGAQRPPANPAAPPDAAPPEEPPTIGSFPRSFVVPGTETSVSVSGSVQTNFGVGR
jgi:hypothetical protein